MSEVVQARTCGVPTLPCTTACSPNTMVFPGLDTMNAGASGDDILRLCFGRVGYVPFVYDMFVPFSDSELSSLTPSLTPLVCLRYSASPFLIASDQLFVRKLDRYVLGFCTNLGPDRCVCRWCAFKDSEKVEVESGGGMRQYKAIKRRQKSAHFIHPKHGSHGNHNANSFLPRIRDARRKQTCLT